MPSDAPSSSDSSGGGSSFDGGGSSFGGSSSSDGGASGYAQGGTDRPVDHDGGQYRPYDGGAAGPQGGSSPGHQYGGTPSYEQGYPQAYQQVYQQPYQQGHQGYTRPYGQGGRSLEGENAAQLSLILGLVGFFFAGVVLGPIAILQAHKAEKLGVPATAGKVLGWISTILWLLGLLSGVAFFVIVLAGLSAAGTYGG